MNDEVDRAVELARLDERIKGLAREQARSEVFNERQIKLAADELARRLDLLNHAHAQAQEVQGKYLPRELFEAFLKETTGRLNQIEGDAREQRGKLWLPMLVAAGIAAGAAAAIVKLFVP